MEYGTNAVMQATAEKLFASTNSPWGKLPWRGASGFNPVASGLTQLPAFRRLLSRELDVKTVCGFWEWRPGLLSYQLTNPVPVSGSFMPTLPEAEQPAAGSKAELRWCDWIALSLANAKQIAAFNPFAPLAQRDAVIQLAQAHLHEPQVSGNPHDASDGPRAR